MVPERRDDGAVRQLYQIEVVDVGRDSATSGDGAPGGPRACTIGRAGHSQDVGCPTRRGEARYNTAIGQVRETGVRATTRGTGEVVGGADRRDEVICSGHNGSKSQIERGEQEKELHSETHEGFGVDKRCKVKLALELS